jgi:hypothetical protein
MLVSLWLSFVSKIKINCSDTAKGVISTFIVSETLVRIPVSSSQDNILVESRSIETYRRASSSPTSLLADVQNNRVSVGKVYYSEARVN